MLASAGNRTKVVGNDRNDDGPGVKQTVEYQYGDLYCATEETERNAGRGSSRSACFPW